MPTEEIPARRPIRLRFRERNTSRGHVQEFLRADANSGRSTLFCAHRQLHPVLWCFDGGTCCGERAENKLQTNRNIREWKCDQRLRAVAATWGETWEYSEGRNNHDASYAALTDRCPLARTHALCAKEPVPPVDAECHTVAGEIHESSVLHARNSMLPDCVAPAVVFSERDCCAIVPWSAVGPRRRYDLAETLPRTGTQTCRASRRRRSYTCMPRN